MLLCKHLYTLHYTHRKIFVNSIEKGCETESIICTYTKWIILGGLNKNLSYFLLLYFLGFPLILIEINRFLKSTYCTASGLIMLEAYFCPYFLITEL